MNSGGGYTYLLPVSITKYVASPVVGSLFNVVFAVIGLQQNEQQVAKKKTHSPFNIIQSERLRYVERSGDGSIRVLNSDYARV
jgi:uncharacterized membrane protein